MKSILIALALLFTSLFANAQSVSTAGGLDAVCQVGFNGPSSNYKDGKFGKNNGKQSETIANANACIGYINGWEEALNGAFIMINDSLRYIEFLDSFDAQNEALALHKYLQDNPLDGGKASPLILLKVAFNGQVVKVSSTGIKNPDQDQEQEQKQQGPVVTPNSIVTTS